MSKVIVVQGEHPFDPYYPLEIFASEASAQARCLELTIEFLTDWWDIAEPDEPMPEVTATNWSELSEKYGGVDSKHNTLSSSDGWGRWWLASVPIEVKP